MSEPNARRRAFSLDAAGQAARSAIKAAWWGGTGAAARLLTKPEESRPEGFAPTSGAAPKGYVRKAWMSAFEKDAADVAVGLYPIMGDRPGGLAGAVREAADFLSDATVVDARRRRGGAVEAREDAPQSEAYPTYYRQNFHYQSGGWLTEDSAKLYDFQVEALFAGTADAMRRQALVPIAAHIKGRDQRSMNLLDVAAGTGRFLTFVKDNWPRLNTTALDLSPAYLEQARKALKPWRDVTFLEANAEAMPLANASQDIVTAIYLFHELPPKVRTIVAKEIARVLKPGGLFVLVDSIQPGDTPGFEALTEFFPQAFHEPYFESYQTWNIAEAFEAAGLWPQFQTPAFLSKVAVFAAPKG